MIKVNGIGVISDGKSTDNFCNSGAGRKVLFLSVFCIVNFQNRVFCSQFIRTFATAILRWSFPAGFAA
jgi:hypothetical protein